MAFDPKLMRFASRMSAAVLTLGLWIYGAFRLGTWLDHKFQTDPWCMLGVVVVSLIAGMAWFIVVATRSEM